MKFCGDLLFEEENSGGGGSDDDDGSGSVDSELTFDFESFCRNMGDGDRLTMTYQEKASMITVEDQYSKGSVEVAR